MKIKFLPVLILASAALLGGCSRLFPARHAHSLEMVIDTRREPSEALAGRFIPGIFPAVTKVPVFFVENISNRAVFTGATCETVQQSGAPLAVLQAVVDKNQVYLEFSSAKAEAASEAHVVVRATYR